MNHSAPINPFRNLWGYALSTLALAIGLTLGWTLHQSQPSNSHSPSNIQSDRENLPVQAGQYHGVDSSWAWITKTHAIAEARIPTAKARDISTFFSRRAFNGAPPRIPHEISESFDRPNCLACHAQGGYVTKFNAYAPMTPHPEYSQCRQCHVPSRTNQEFKGNNFLPASTVLSSAAFNGAPPPIPHTLQLRENCSSCHVGPGAVHEIRTKHPERIGCLQCHVPAQSTQEFSRPSSFGGEDSQP
jgi:nitrate reductase (cytochrome), electron transfer subunit